MMHLSKFKLVFLLLFVWALSLTNAVGQPMARLSIDFRGGMPSVISKDATQSAAPYAGLGVRYAFNGFLSLSVDANGGVIAGKTSNGFFRNNFIQYGGKVHLNPMAFIKNRPDALKRFNTYLSFGMNNMNYYYTLQSSTDNKLGRTFFMYDAGFTIRYYANEMIDFMVGTNFNFTETSAIDNLRTSNNDHFALTYAGISIKLLPYERKQAPDWAHVALPYNTGTMAITKQLVKDLEKDMGAQNQKSADSIAALRGQINVVDEKVVKVNSKVDSVDAKLNLVLELLNKMQTQGVNVNQLSLPASETTGTKTTANNKPSTAKGKKGQAVPKSQAKETNNIVEEDNNPGVNNSNTVATAVIPPSKTTATGVTKPAVIDQSKVKENYAIVVGSFQVDENAIKARDRYITKGWDAHILGNVHSPYKRIVIFSNNYYEAAKIVTELRNAESPDVWMLDIATGKGVYIK